MPTTMPPPPPNQAGRIIGILILLLYLYSAPGQYSSGPASGFRSPREQFHAHLGRQRQAFNVLNSSQYGDFMPERGGPWLNLTGFREGDGYAWSELGKVKEKVEKQREKYKDAPLGGVAVGWYQNVSGIMHGTWRRAPEYNEDLVRSGRERMNLSEIAPWVHWGYGVWNRNVTGWQGKVMLTVEEKDEVKGEGKNESPREAENENRDGFVMEVSATMTVEDKKSTSGDGWEMRLHGVHWPQRGELVMTTTSTKFAGIFGLPHLMTSKADFESSQKVLIGTLHTVLEKKEKSGWNDFSDPWPSDDSTPVPHCEYVVYLQVQKFMNNEFDGFSTDFYSEIKDIEEELRFPDGAPIFKPPPLRMSLLVFSPDCGFMLESMGPPEYAWKQHLSGYKQEVFVQRTKHWSLVWGIALFGQVLFTRMQMKEASTPSTLSRISFYTVGMMLVADSLLFVSLMLLAASAPAVFPAATLAALAVGLSLGMGVRFLVDVYNVQEPERRERERERAQAARPPSTQPTTTPATPPSITAAGLDSLPLPAMAARPASTTDIPVIIPSDQDIDAEIAEVTSAGAAAVQVNAQAQRPPANAVRNSSDMTASYGQFLMLFMCLFFLTVSSTSWPTVVRSTYINGLAIIYLSFWTPQIYRNVIRNCRKALLWKFVLGQSILRIAPFTYFYLKEDNVLFADTSSVGMMVLAGWLWAQICVLAAQEVLGPRFGLPKGWLPEAWDYHPILREDDTEGGGMPIGLVKAPGSPRLERVRIGEEGRKKSDAHTWSVDCAICMHVIDVPVVPAGEDGISGVASGAGGVSGMLARRLYMVTPCRHVFHSVCLEGWMRFRLQCPICRENLPPL